MEYLSFFEKMLRYVIYHSKQITYSIVISAQNTFGGRQAIISDIYLLIAAVAFGLGFLGQRAAVLNGVRPLVCTSARFFLSTVLLILMRPFLPSSFKMLKPVVFVQDENVRLNVVSESVHKKLRDYSFPADTSPGLYWGLILGKYWNS